MKLLEECREKERQLSKGSDETAARPKSAPFSFYQHVGSRLHDQTEAQIQKLKARERELKAAAAKGDEGQKYLLHSTFLFLYYQKNDQITRTTGTTSACRNRYRNSSSSTDHPCYRTFTGTAWSRAISQTRLACRLVLRACRSGDRKSTDSGCLIHDRISTLRSRQFFAGASGDADDQKPLQMTFKMNTVTTYKIISVQVHYVDALGRARQCAQPKLDRRDQMRLPATGTARRR